ncbi:MAG: phage GP46 family protein [Thermoplasmatales archaeon]|nr:MAG: phage GP46 family protein [Thermoplasmatales archaeon]
MSLDIALEKNSSGYYDIDFNSKGDFVLTDGLDTAIRMSVLCEKRADESEVIKPEYRRGDWSNELNEVDGYEVGSKFWLLDSARTNEESINIGVDAINDGLQWMIDDLLIKSVEAVGNLTSRGVTFTVEVDQIDDRVNTFLFDAFESTGS